MAETPSGKNVVFFLVDATDKVRLAANKSDYFRRKPIYPLSFFGNTPFKETVELFQVTLHLRFTKVPLKACLQAKNNLRFKNVLFSIVVSFRRDLRISASEIFRI